MSKAVIPNQNNQNLYNGDFRRYFDKTQKRNIWALGYFGGGAVNICESMKVAEDYAKENKVPIETVKIDEILHSSRYKGFKVVYSTDAQKPSEHVEKSDYSDNVWQWLHD